MLEGLPKASSSPAPLLLPQSKGISNEAEFFQSSEQSSRSKCSRLLARQGQHLLKDERTLGDNKKNQQMHRQNEHKRAYRCQWHVCEWGAEPAVPSDGCTHGSVAGAEGNWGCVTCSDSQPSFPVTDTEHSAGGRSSVSEHKHLMLCTLTGVSYVHICS